MADIGTRPLHGISDILSLNEGKQLVKNLTRPIAEISKLVQLAKQHQQNVLKNQVQIASRALPQYDVRILRFDHPRTICVNEDRLNKN